MKLFRLLKIAHTLAAYRISGLMPARGINFFAVINLLSPFGVKGLKHMSQGQRVRGALESLGPIFIKLGQTLSTRPDLIPVEIAQALEKLQDDVEPISWDEAKAVVQEQLPAEIRDQFASVDETALASASIAQVHAAQLKNGDEVVIKVLRPGIGKRIKRDVTLMQALASFAKNNLNPGVQVDPTEIVAEFEKTIYDELDLQREAANASVLKKNFKDSKDLYIPNIYWDFCKEKVMVQERIFGISIKDFAGLKAAGINFEKLAEKGIKIFYTQVFRDNFFHADMHPGNIFISKENPEDPQILLLDFGICGSLPKGHRVDLANNFMAFFKEDYRRVAELHIESGWVPADTNLEDLESATRTICEPYMSRPIEEISFGEVMLKTFQMAKRFKLIVQPELILLQKTLLNIEGLGRQLYPQLDIWQLSEPILRDIMKTHYGPEHSLEKLKENLPKWIEQAAETPMLVHQLLSLQVKPLPRHIKIEQQLEHQAQMQETKKNRYTLLTVGGLITTALLYSLDQSSTWVAWSPNSAIITAGLTAWMFWKSIK
ncbi:2-polyprenylphenol 6-hydroxylase [Marinicella sp. S1101]|uniref:2-polyprenylphenol 6-hydroxylase n=1 Tax=Marinicella marina TaxID=2996016 RepID=UPI002260A573|nr:2-polyprenylphenol 6-hydroxylase [Marinicella marina]MCX7554426.1 2-polyprenylphenol 6-hydroxylase [Marinicella marina]MDJ1140577.1 2-polyprenylphenol 6-hydroxylase [Marinicella marina]